LRLGCVTNCGWQPRPSPHYHCDKAIDRGLPVLRPQSHLDFRSHSCQWGYSECTWDISLELQRLPARCQNISMGTRFQLRFRFRSRSLLAFFLWAGIDALCGLLMRSQYDGCPGRLSVFVRQIKSAVFSFQYKHPKAEPDGIGNRFAVAADF